MYNLIAIALLIIGLVLLFSVDMILDKNTTNSTLKSIYDNKTIVGSVCVAGSYYAYLLSQKNMNHSHLDETHFEVPSRIPYVGDKSPSYNLPSYNDSVETSDVLKL